MILETAMGLKSRIGYLYLYFTMALYANYVVYYREI
jgi:hypothetical protein